MTTELPSCCEYRGLFYPDGRRACRRHATDTDRQLVDDLDRRAKPILGPRGWPYGPNIDVQARQDLLDWAEHLGVSLTQPRCQNLHWLRVGRCAVRICEHGGHWMDHVTRWKRNGRPALLLAQPYSLTDDEHDTLAALDRDGGLTVRIGEGWYGHGTVSVEVWRTDALAEAPH